MKKLIAVVTLIIVICISILILDLSLQKEPPKQQNPAAEVPEDAPFLHPVRITNAEQAIDRYREWVVYPSLNDAQFF